MPEPIGELIAILTADTRNFQSKMEEAVRLLETLAGQAEETGDKAGRFDKLTKAIADHVGVSQEAVKTTVKFGAAVGTAVTAIEEVTRRSAEWANQVKIMSAQTGISTTELQRWE